MKDNISRSPMRRSGGFHRLLKPGALAQIRNSRFSARSTFSLSLSQKLDLSSSLSQSSVAEVTAPQNLTTNQVPVPHLLRKIYGPSSLMRKKVAAARSISSTMMMMMNLNPPITSVIEPTAGNNPVLTNDVIAH